MTDSGSGRSDPETTLTFFCAAGLRQPVEAIVADYERDYGVAVQIQYGGSGTLLSNLEVADRGDLYLAADDSYIELAREAGLVVESIPIARMRPVIAVARGNPKEIDGLDDLLDPEVATALSNPDAAAIGRISQQLFEQIGRWSEMREAVAVLKPTVNDVANDIRLGTVDAGIVWDALVAQFDDLEAIAIPEGDALANLVSIGVLEACEQPREALAFARYLTARDRGLLQFAEDGYKVVEGDVWSEQPEILLYSGAMLRPGLSEAVRRFEEREGVLFNTVYNGCGILVSQMKTGDQPEAYVSCDISFMDEVRDRFLPSKNLTENDMVILVAKGNPLGIVGLEDLARDGVRVGLAEPSKSALGALAKRLLDGQGLYDSVLANRVVDSATGDFLVNQIRAGGLDATIVYRSNANANPENLKQHLDLIEIEAPDATAVQPYAVSRDSDNKQLLERFFATVRDAESRDQFESFGFRWRAEDEEGEAPSSAEEAESEAGSDDLGEQG